MKHKGLFLLLAILFTLFAATPAAAQEIRKFHVESFGENPFDMSGREKPTSRDDGTGVLYSIIKVTSTDPDDNLKAYRFNFGYLKDVREMHDGVLWVYVQNGAKTVDIMRDGFHTIRRYNLETTLQPGKVYDMVLKPEPKVISMQNLLFVVEPANSKAMIMYTDESGEEKLFGQVDEEGCAFKKLVLGKYFYKIISESYHTSEGVVTLSTPSGKHTETVTLRPNFSNITLTVENGADIYINDEKRGTGQWSGNLSHGTYSIECRKANHKSTLETITVEDGKNTTYTLKAPTPIVGSLSISSTPLRAQISIDGKAVGETPEMIDGLIIGNHKVTISKDGYETATADVVIKENETTEHNVELTKKENAAPIVSKGNIQNNSNVKNIGSTAKRGSITSAPYKIGDYYNDGKKEGVVFEVRNNGYSGKIVSLEQIECKWSLKNVKTDATSNIDGMYNMQKIRSLKNWQRDYPAFAWCASLGEEWYLPAIEELEAIYAQDKLIDNTLKTIGKSPFRMNQWSSTEDYEKSRALMAWSEHSLEFKSKELNYFVRAVSAFNTDGNVAYIQNSGNNSKSGPITSAPYKVGDYYNDGKKEGVVFEVSKDGNRGKIISLEQNKYYWSEKDVKTDATSEIDGMYNMQKIRSLNNWQKDFPAFAWCASLGEGWYLPALEELKSVYTKCAVINNTLKAQGKSVLSYYYWSSTQYRYHSSIVWFVGMYDGYTSIDKNSNLFSVRAVSAFNADGSVSSTQNNGNTFTVNGVTFKMIPVKGGTFSMGATSEQKGCSSEEMPVHSVTLSDYYIGETEVTQTLWQAVMGSNPSTNKGDDFPIQHVYYNDCITFIEKLNSLLSAQLPAGKKFRLPTEAEWEYAARGGNQSKGYQYSGSNTLDDIAWYSSNSGDKPHPVKQKQPNELGIYDMSGNAWELCSDWYGWYSSTAQINPTGPLSGSERVERGGSYLNNSAACRVAYRSGITTDDMYYCTSGLRLALDGATAAVGASEQRNASSAQSEAKSGPKTSAPYKIGDYYNDGTKEGIVFEVSNGGLHGKIVSLEENKFRAYGDIETGATSKKDGMSNMLKIRSLPNWQDKYPAFAWCTSFGNGWYLPALKELEAINAQRAAINKILKEKGKLQLSGWYWSSTEKDKDYSWLVCMGENSFSPDDYYKYEKFPVRAVAAF